MLNIFPNTQYLTCTQAKNTNDILNHFCQEVKFKFTKTEKKFISWLKKEISVKGKFSHRILDQKVFVAISQDNIAKKFKVARRTVIRAIKRLEQLGIIIKAKLSDMYIDHTYSYAFALNQPEKITDGCDTTGVTKTGVNVTISNKNIFSRYFYKSINQKKNIEEKKQEIPARNSHTGAEETQEKSNQSLKSASVTLEKEGESMKISEMHDVAIEVLGEKLSYRLTKDIAKWMGSARNVYFKTLSLWKRFLNAIKNSAWLMRDAFKLSIKWILKFETIQRILDGSFGVKFEESFEWNKALAEEKEKKEAEEFNSMIDSIDAKNETEICKKLRLSLLAKLGVSSYNSWFSKAHLEERDGGFVLGVSSNFLYDSIQNKFRELLDGKNILLKKVNYENS